MKDPQIKGDTKVIGGPARLSYTHVFAKYAPDSSQEGKYMTNILIPKTEKKTIAAIEQAIEAAKALATKSKWGGKLPKKLDTPLRDGDEKEDEVYHGHYYLNAKASTRPEVVDKNRERIIDEEEIYSGVWCYFSISFYGYSVSGNNGIACGLNNLMKFKDDEHLGGRASASSDFSDFEDVDDDDI